MDMRIELLAAYELAKFNAAKQKKAILGGLDIHHWITRDASVGRSLGIKPLCVKSDAELTSFLVETKRWEQTHQHFPSKSHSALWRESIPRSSV